MSQSSKQSVDTNEFKDCLYGIFSPGNGWVYKSYIDRLKYLGNEGKTEGITKFLYQNTPRYYTNAEKTKALAYQAKAQFIVFDVVPCLRSWPHEEVSSSV